MSAAAPAATKPFYRIFAFYRPTGDKQYIETPSRERAIANARSLLANSKDWSDTVVTYVNGEKSAVYHNNALEYLP